MKTITAQDILDILPIVQGQGWRVQRSGCIKNAIRNDKMQCPVCALAIVAGASAVYAECATIAFEEAFGFCPRGSVWDIADAADYPDHRIRPALMRALGMKP